MKELYIDFDGVILDTLPYLDEGLMKANIPFDDEDAVYEFLSTFDYLPCINDNYIINDSINKIYSLINCNKFNISILTHICSLKEGMHKINYLRNYFKDITIILVPRQISKTKLVHTKDAILVDDKNFNLKEWNQEGGISIKFSKLKTDSEFSIINYLDELIEMF